MSSGLRPNLRVLLLEDSDLDAELTLDSLAREYDVTATRVFARGPFEEAVRTGGFDVVLADYSLPSFDGLQALAFMREVAADAPFIFVSGVLGEEFATEALKSGATDYVVKQRLARLPAVVRRALIEAETRLERSRAERQSALLVAELSHRVKNTLGIVSSIAKLTLSHAKSLPDFEEAFLSRLGALAVTHTLLLEGGYSQADMLALATRTLAPFQSEGRITVRGHSILLPPKPALALGMVMHELAANAALHGALSLPSGRVELCWTLESDLELVLRWVERHGPPVSEPSRTGFGTLLIQQSARYELDGEATLRFQREGFDCEIRVPITWPQENRRAG